MNNKKTIKKGKKSNNKTQSNKRTTITLNDIKKEQKKWGDSIVEISKSFLNKEDFVKIAKKNIKELYGYDYGKVLFKPTKAVDVPFRNTKTGALSYFVGNKAINNGYKEDNGFAINGGNGWKKVTFKNNSIDLNGNVTTAMGTYTFTCAKSGNKVKVYYTFGYKRNKDGNIRIYLHHSSVPFLK